MNSQPLKLGCSYVQNTVKELSLDLEKKKDEKIHAWVTVSLPW